MSWWRSQRRALIALVIVAAAMLGATVWLDILPSIRSTDRVIEAESTVDIAGQTLTLGPTEWGEFDTSDGSRTLSIRLSSSGGSEASLCGQTTLTEIDSGRTWLSSRDDLDVSYDEGENSCTAEPASYRILLTFLLPDDADGPFLLDIEGSDNDLARFRLDP
jgi:hypothetical protein